MGRSVSKLEFPHYQGRYLPKSPRRSRRGFRLTKRHYFGAVFALAMVPVLSMTIGERGSSSEAFQPTPAAMKAPAPPPPPAPPALQARLDELVERYGEKVGIAVMDVDQEWIATVNGEDFFPQQSVSKTWVALTVLDAIDRGRLALDQDVFMTRQDRSVFHQPIVRHIGSKGFTTDVADLLTRALTESDNAANDMLIKLVGGVEVVTSTLESKGLEGLRMGADEKRLQAMIAGVPWSDDLVLGDRFRVARANLPEYVRDHAMDTYVADPLDGATPVGIVQALAKLKRGQLLSSAGTEHLIETMIANTTGHSRLRAGAPRDWKVGDKTGTGQDWDGASVGINDIALMTAPDGRTYAVAVMIQRTRHSFEARRTLMQSVSRAVVQHWRDEPASRPIVTQKEKTPSSG